MDGRLAVGAFVGCCPRGAWDEGVRSVVDTEGGGGCLGDPLGSRHCRDVSPPLALGAELEVELSLLIVLGFGSLQFLRSL